MAFDRRKRAASRCFGAGCVRNGFQPNRVFMARTNDRLATAGHTEHQPRALSGAGFQARPVRAALPAAYAEACEEVFHDDVGSEVERQRKLQVAGSNPARQPLDSSEGRASVQETDCRGFESRSKTMTCHVMTPGTKVPTRKRLVWNAARSSAWRADRVTQRGSSRAGTLKADGRSSGDITAMHRGDSSMTDSLPKRACFAESIVKRHFRLIR